MSDHMANELKNLQFIEDFLREDVEKNPEKYLRHLEGAVRALPNLHLGYPPEAISPAPRNHRAISDEEVHFRTLLRLFDQLFTVPVEASERSHEDKLLMNRCMTGVGCSSKQYPLKSLRLFSSHVVFADFPDLREHVQRCLDDSVNLLKETDPGTLIRILGKMASRNGIFEPWAVTWAQGKVRELKHTQPAKLLTDECRYE